MKSFDAYFFDLYGTLVDIHTDFRMPGLWRGLSCYMAAHGAEWSPRALHRMYEREVAAREAAMRAANPRPSFCPEIDMGDVFRAMYAARNVDADDALIAATAWDFRQRMTSHLRVYAGAKALLSALKQQGRVVLVSNAQSLFTRPELELLGLSDAFDAIYISSECGCRKPDPAFFRMAAERFDLDPARCLMIGNDPVCDVGGAVNAGLAACYIRSAISPKNAPPACSEAVYSLPNMNLRALKALLTQKKEDA